MEMPKYQKIALFIISIIFIMIISTALIIKYSYLFAIITIVVAIILGIIYYLINFYLDKNN